MKFLGCKKCYKYLTSIGLVFALSLFSANASAGNGEELLVPIFGDITIFVPILTAPSTPLVNERPQTTGGSIYELSWNAVGNANYYQIEVTDENGETQRIETPGLDYRLAGLPLGQSTIKLLACNSQDQCGAKTLIGTYHTSERIRYTHADILGSPILETDQAQNVIRQMHYKPFGESEEDKQEDIGYAGHLEDTDLKLTYMQARYYDPVLGRFYSNDPVAYSSVNPIMSFNRYIYVNNNPYKYTDPDGEFLNFAVKFAADVALGAALNYMETGSVNFGGAVTEAAIGILNPAKTLQKAKRIANLAKKGKSSGGNCCSVTKKADDTIYRMGTSNESKTRLGKKAQEAEDVIGNHGVSGSTTKPSVPCSSASCSSLEDAGFNVTPTPTRRDPNHVTIELPKPVTKEVADKFNNVFGR